MRVNREFKIQVRYLRMMIVEKGEIIKENTKHSDAISYLKPKVGDLEEEHELNNIKLASLEKVKSTVTVMAQAKL
jgi:hypothetical protein